MSSDTGPAASEVRKLREAIENARGVNYGIQQPVANGNGKAELHKIALMISGFLSVTVLAIFGWVAVHVIEQQDDQSRRLATVEAKLDILLSNKNAK